MNTGETTRRVDFQRQLAQIGAGVGIVLPVVSLWIYDNAASTRDPCAGLVSGQVPVWPLPVVPIVICWIGALGTLVGLVGSGRLIGTGTKRASAALLLVVAAVVVVFATGVLYIYYSGSLARTADCGV